jgi:ParB/RepB/Spo0J family partition protein
MFLANLDQQDILEPAAPIRATIDQDGLDELADSIAELGLLQPICVAPKGEKYEVICGHRRLLATRRLGMPKVHCLVADDGEESTVLAGRVHENLIRRDISPVEEAAFYAELMEKYNDVDKVCSVVRRSRNVVENRLLLLTGDREVLAALNTGKVSLAVASELNREPNEAKRKWFLEFAIKDGATLSTLHIWRKSYESFLPADIAMSGPPAVAPDGVTAVAAKPHCYLCGGYDAQHTMRWVTIHSSCQEVAVRLGWQIHPLLESADGNEESGQ